MPEVAFVREDHRQASLIGCVDDLLVANRATRLDDGRGTGIDGGLKPIPEREERDKCPAPSTCVNHQRAKQG